MGNNKTTDWIQTFTGKMFWPLEPNKEDICIEDIAHALSNICRFTGHCKEFYSVAKHSILGAFWLERSGYPKDIVLGFLLHDASEAYLCDIPRPLKKAMPWYKRKENELLSLIYQKYIPVEKSIAEWEDLENIIKRTDNDMLFWEACEFMNYDEHVAVWKKTFSEEDFKRFHKSEYKYFRKYIDVWANGSTLSTIPTTEDYFIRFFERLK